MAYRGELGRYINPLTDFGFKKIFGEEGSKDRLASFIYDILGLKNPIKNIEFKKNEQIGTKDENRKAVFDLFCEDDKGNKFIVEMQNARQTYFKDRAIFYSSFPIQEQGRKGENWDFKLSAIYCIGILGFEMPDEKKNSDYLHRVHLKNQKNEIFYDKLNYVFVELPKFKKTENDKMNHIEKWIYFLKHLPEFDKIPDILNDKVFKEAFKVAEVSAFSDEKLVEYEKSLRVYRDNINVIDTAREEGREEGEERKAIEIAKSLLDVLDLKTIALKTGLTLEKVERLVKKN